MSFFFLLYLKEFLLYDRTYVTSYFSVLYSRTRFRTYSTGFFLVLVQKLARPDMYTFAVCYLVGFVKNSDTNTEYADKNRLEYVGVIL